MIQFKRGKTENWFKNKTKLAAGQPGFDKDKNKIKIGDGEHAWSELPYASGLSNEDIFSSEKEAKLRRKAAKLLNPLTALLDSPAVITYGDESPDKDTIGQVYLQCYDAEPEVDYVVDYGVDGIWVYRKWCSGFAECFGTLELSTPILEAVGGMFMDNKAMSKINYPITFIGVPTEVASLQSPGGIAWLACRTKNTGSSAALYNIISPDKQSNIATYSINISVSGRWK